MIAPDKHHRGFLVVQAVVEEPVHAGAVHSARVQLCPNTAHGEANLVGLCESRGEGGEGKVRVMERMEL